MSLPEKKKKEIRNGDLGRKLTFFELGKIPLSPVEKVSFEAKTEGGIWPCLTLKEVLRLDCQGLLTIGYRREKMNHGSFWTSISAIKWDSTLSSRQC